MSKGSLRPPSSLPTRSEHMANTYPELAMGGGGKKPPTNKKTMTGGPSPDDNENYRNGHFLSGAGSARLNETSDLGSSGYPLGFSGWFDHAEQQDEKSRRNYEEYGKYSKGK